MPMASYIQDTTATLIAQDALTVSRRRQAVRMAYVMRDLGFEGRYTRMLDCGSTMQWAVDRSTGEALIVSANLCRDRMCPQCAWYRSRKIYAQVSQVMDAMPKTGVRYLFLTLTVRNVEAAALTDTIDRMMHGWTSLTKRAVWAYVRGYFRALEITYNAKADTYHPHIHAILAVRPSMLARHYVTHDAWMDEWRAVMQTDYDPYVDIRTVKPDAKGLGGAVAEVAKYAVKPGDYMHDPRVVEVLASALAGRRLVAYGGEMLKMHGKLGQDDPVDGKLVGTEKLRPDVAYMIYRFQWDFGAGAYLCHSREEVGPRG